MPSKNTFAVDVADIRKRARAHLEKGAITENYGGDPDNAVELLNSALATEIVCVLRYTMHAVCATGIASEGPKGEFEQHAKEEREHANMIAERINQLGGTPNFNPEGLSSRATSQFGPEKPNLVEMIKENLVAERIAIEHYRDLVRYFAEKDPSTRRMLEYILSQEEEHANDMHDLLVAHEGTPFLKK